MRVVADEKRRQPCFMRNLKTIRRQASGVARAANGPLGARPLQRVVSDHLGFFAGLRADGASWEQIAALMAAEGLRSRAGSVVSAGVLRALCSRAAAENASGSIRVTAGPSVSSNDTAERRIAIPVTRADLPPLGGSLAETIARAARLRGMTSNNGNDDDET